MGAYGLVGCHEWCMFDHDNAAWISWIVLRPQHATRNFVQFICWLPTFVRSIFWIGVHPDIITIRNPKFFRVFRIHVDLMVTESRRAFVTSVGVAEVARPQLVPIHYHPRGMDGVAGLSRGNKKKKNLFFKINF